MIIEADDDDDGFDSGDTDPCLHSSKDDDVHSRQGLGASSMMILCRIPHIVSKVFCAI